MTKTKRVFIIICIVLASIFLLLSLATLFYYYADNYDEFYARAEKSVTIPGIEDGFTQQGFTYVRGEDIYAFSGYMKNENLPSRVYLVNSAGETIKYFTLKFNVEDYFGHAGGITQFGNLFWLATTEGYVYTFYLSDALNVENGGAVVIKDSFEVGNNADYCSVVGSTLWIGEFYRAGNYETNSSHHIECADGTNMAVIFGYTINEENFAGLDSTVPNKVLSVTNLVQGMTITDSGKIVLSTSYSIPNSTIYVYKDVLSEPSDTNLYIDNNIVPVWILDSEVLEEKISAPCMTEDLDYVDGKVYISFESACKKYSLFVREQVPNVYSIKID